jgi:hypothetical protein
MLDDDDDNHPVVHIETLIMVHKSSPETLVSDQTTTPGKNPEILYNSIHKNCHLTTRQSNVNAFTAVINCAFFSFLNE